MSSISGRTAYVVLSSIEEEFRTIVDRHAGDDDPMTLLGPTLLDTVLERRRRERFTAKPRNVGPLLPYLDFQDSYELANKLAHRLPAELAGGLRAIGSKVNRTVAVRNRVAHNRPLDIDDLPTVLDLANEIALIPGWGWENVAETLTEIRQDPGYIFRVTANLIADPDTAVANNLPAPDFDETSLLGRKDERRQILKALRGSWPVISILGDGGIGKTALALQVCYDIVEQVDCPFEAVAWVSAKNSQLTSTEIVRIESAVGDSLGLFASAAADWGGSGNPETAIDDLIEVLESFPILLVLDNVETILDESFPRFLREVPVGSKVLITSRIGVKTENPFKLHGLSEDDAIKLMRILARSRNFNLAKIARTEDLANWARRMKCHPAYIKWFIAGLQTGQLPEALLNDNGLVLDFCMSNVFGYLSETAKSVLRAMLVVPGAHTMAELASLAQLDSSTIQQAILDLTTTNFVAQVRGGASGTALQLSDFAREYLRRKLRTDEAERIAIVERHKHLYAVGGGLQAAHALDPYAPDTIDIRGVGDYSAAKSLREAIELGVQGKFDDGLQLCSEASELAPGYHEVARVEAWLYESATNFSEAYEAYSRAKDLAPDDPYIAFFFGNFLVSSGFDPVHGIRELQRAANLDTSSSRLHISIAHAFAKTGDYRQAIDAAVYAVGASREVSQERRDYLYYLWQNCGFNIHELSRKKQWSQIAEDAEFAWSACQDLRDDAFAPSTLDLILWVEDMLSPGTSTANVDDYIAKKVSRLSNEMTSMRVRLDKSQSDRRVGSIRKLKDTGGYGFVRAGNDEFFFHARNLWERDWFDSLKNGSVLVFTPGTQPSDGKPQAMSIHWVR